jgi:hypothetical protein
MKKQLGGVFYPDKRDKYRYFTNYLYNSDFDVLALTGENMILKSTFNKSVNDMPYGKIMPGADFGMDVKNLVFKFVPISNDKDYKQFIDEINVQTEVYFKTIKYLQPLCPGIVYTEVVSKNNLDEIKSSIDLNDAIEFFNKNEDADIGIIVMEIAENFKTYDDIVANEEENDSYIYSFIVMYANIILALETNYIHEAMHGGNILFLRDKNYFSDIPIRPVIIDFGEVKKLTPAAAKSLKHSFEKGNFFGCLKIIEQSSRHQYLGLLNTFKQQTTFKEAYPNETIHNAFNLFVSNLLQQRQKAIFKNEETMKNLNSNNSMYPTIPLSNTYKNKLYEGILTGGKRRNVKKKSMKRTKSKRKTRKIIF